MSFDLKNISYTESSDKKNTKVSCTWLQRFHKCLSKQFYNLGLLIASSPSYFIIIPIFVSLIFVTGLQKMEYEKDPEYLFSPSNAKGREERKIVETLFPVNYSQSFDPSRITKISPLARLLVTTKDNQTMLRTRVWNDVMTLDAAIQKISVEWQEKIYKYEDVCAIWNSKCIENQILSLHEIMPEVENGSMLIDYPVMLFPLVFPFSYGGVKVNESEGYLESVKGIALHYWLRADNWMQKERAIMWENKVLELLHTQDFGSINISPFVSMSLEDELEKNTSYIISYLLPTVFIMSAFSIISVTSCDWVKSKIQVSVMGIVTAGLGIGCSFGLLMYCKVPFIGINWAAPFLLIGIGIDDMFVVLSAWQRTRIQDDVPIRLANTYSEAAVSITITSLTNTLSFFIGAITPFPSVYIFCIYTGVAIMFTYVFFITFFGGCLALAGYQEKKQRHALSCKPVKSKSESENDGCCYRFWCSGGINKDDPWNRKDNKPHFLMACFGDYFAKALNVPYIKALVICSFLIYLAGAIYGCLQVQEGLEKRDLALDESYLTSYYEIEDSLFRKLPYRIQVVINENITYSDPKTKKQLLVLHRSFENLTCIGPRIFTESWIRDFYRFLHYRPHLKKKITDEKSFIAVLKEEYLTPGTRDYLDVVFNEDDTQIIASRFIIQSYDIKDTNADKDMMLDVRKVAENAPFKVITYYPLFVFFDQFVLVAPLTVKTISLVAFVMMVVSFIFIANPLCCLWVIFSIISIEVGVLGYMVLWGVRLDCISMINLIMCIGFSVDFSAHISYSYLTAKDASPDERVKECMFNLGLPVLQSGLSTIAGVLVFIVAPSSIFRTFFKIICLVIIFGIMHAIFLLPVMLSLLGPGSCRTQRKNVSLRKTIVSISESVPNAKISAQINANNETKIFDNELGSRSSQSTCSDSDNHDDSDTESTRTSSRSQDSGEYGGTSNLAYVVEEEEDCSQGVTYL